MASGSRRTSSFTRGEVMPELRLHYTTVGAPTGQPVLVLHGSGELSRQHADISLCRRIVRTGATARCVEILHHHPRRHRARQIVETIGLRCERAFRNTDYNDMVDAQYRLVTEGLGIKHLRLVIGNSMGGMHTWIWGVQLSADDGRAVADGLAADARWRRATGSCGGQCWRTIRNDPDYNGSNYTSQPRMMKYAIAAYRFASAGGTAGLSDACTDRAAGRQAGRRAAGAAGHRRRQRLHLSMGSLARLRSVGREWRRSWPHLLAINAADDERNPPETGVTEAAVRRIKNGKIYLIPASTRDARASHDRRRQILLRSIAGVAASHAAASDVAGKPVDTYSSCG